MKKITGRLRLLDKHLHNMTIHSKIILTIGYITSLLLMLSVLVLFILDRTGQIHLVAIHMTAAYLAETAINIMTISAIGAFLLEVFSARQKD